MALTDYLDDNNFLSKSSRGLISGFLGGIAGTMVKLAAEAILPVRQIDPTESQLKVIDNLSETLTGEPLQEQYQPLVEQLVSFPVGASVGAAYGYGKKDKDELNIAEGAILGASTYITTYQTSLMEHDDDSVPGEGVPMVTKISEVATHLLFGITTELVRSYINKRLKEKDNPIT